MPSPGPAKDRDLFFRGIAHFEEGDIGQAEACFQEGLQLAIASGNHGAAGSFFHELALTAQRRGQLDVALALFRKAIHTKLAASADPRTPAADIGETLHSLAALYDMTGNSAAAPALFAMARECREADRDYDGLGATLHSLAVTALGSGDGPSALGYFMEAYHVGLVAGDHRRRQKSAVAVRELSGAGVALPPTPADASRLPKELGDALAAQESDPQHIPAARSALEAALTFQLRRIARGLLADRILRSMEMSDVAWWLQYASLHDLVPQEPDLELTAFRAFREGFCQEALHRRMARIRPEQLIMEKLRVFGGEVFFWQEGCINHQLAGLGSSSRLVVVNSERARLHRAAGLAGEEFPIPAIRSFIFGVVAPRTAKGRFSSYAIGRELAVSAYLNGDSPAFAAGWRTVSRESVPRGVLDAIISPEGHEIGHLLQKSPLGSREGLRAWRPIVREDLCRYAREPRLPSEISAEFDFSNPLHIAMMPPGEKPASLAELLAELCSDGLMVKQPDGRYYSPIYEEGRRWRLA